MFSLMLTPNPPRKSCCPSRSRDMAAGWFNVPNNDFSKILAHATPKAVKTIPSGLLEKVVERLKAEFQPDEI